MLWKLSLHFASPCSSSITMAVLARTLWKTAAADTSSQSPHCRSCEVSVSVALGVNRDGPLAEALGTQPQEVLMCCPQKCLVLKKQTNKHTQLFGTRSNKLC